MNHRFNHYSGGLEKDTPPTEPEIVKRARKVLKDKNRLRWNMLVAALFFFGFTVYMGRHLLDWTKDAFLRPGVTEGFVDGFAVGFIVVVFGSIGALFVAKALVGFSKDFDEYKLLVKYHDELMAMNDNGADGAETPPGKP